MDSLIRSADKGITDGMKIVSYVQDHQGNQALVAGAMWHPVDIVNSQAWAEIDRQIKAAKVRVTAGRASCLYYYMVANQMNIGLLAAYSGQSRWLVRLHMVPFFFNRLSTRTLNKYAETFKVSADDLLQGKLRPPVYQQQEHEARSFA